MPVFNNKKVEKSNSPGYWDTTVSYVLHAKVLSIANGLVYESIIGSNKGNPLSNDDAWEIDNSSGGISLWNPKRKYTTPVSYVIGPGGGLYQALKNNTNVSPSISPLTWKRHFRFGGKNSLIKEFVKSDIDSTTHVYTVAHALNTTDIIWAMKDPNQLACYPDIKIVNSSTVTIDFSNIYTTMLSGTYNLLLCGNIDIDTTEPMADGGILSVNTLTGDTQRNVNIDLDSIMGQKPSATYTVLTAVAITALQNSISKNTNKVGISIAQAAQIITNSEKKGGGLTPAQSEAIVLNTSKTGISAGQAASIATNILKVGLTPTQAHAITLNTSKGGVSPTQIAAILANTSKVGITPAQISAVTANTLKIGVTATNLITLKNVITSPTALTAGMIPSIDSARVIKNGYSVGSLKGNIAILGTDNMFADEVIPQRYRATAQIFKSNVNWYNLWNVTPIVYVHDLAVVEVAGQDLAYFMCIKSYPTTTKLTIVNYLTYWQEYKLSLGVVTANGYTSHTISIKTGDISEAKGLGTITNLWFTDARVTANLAVKANTAKVGITPKQAAAIGANTAKVVITNLQSAEINSLGLNVTKNIATLSTLSKAISLNTDKVSITPTQTNAIVANTKKVGITPTQVAKINTNTSGGFKVGDYRITASASDTVRPTDLPCSLGSLELDAKTYPELAKTYNVTEGTFLTALPGGHFIRNVGGNAGALNASQGDMFKSHTHTWGRFQGGYKGGGNSANIPRTGGSTGASGGIETRPVNTTLNFFQVASTTFNIDAHNEWKDEEPFEVYSYLETGLLGHSIKSSINLIESTVDKKVYWHEKAKNCTIKTPLSSLPDFKVENTKYSDCFKNDEWSRVENNIGMAVYSTETGLPTYIDYLGPIKSGFTTIAPPANSIYYTFSNTQWVLNPSAKSNLIVALTSQIEAKALDSIEEQIWASLSSETTEVDFTANSNKIRFTTLTKAKTKINSLSAKNIKELIVMLV